MGGQTDSQVGSQVAESRKFHAYHWLMRLYNNRLLAIYLRPNLSSTKVSTSRRKSMQVDASGWPSETQVQVRLARVFFFFLQGLSTWKGNDKALTILFFLQFSLQISNTSELSITYSLKLDSLSPLRHSRAQFLPRFLEPYDQLPDNQLHVIGKRSPEIASDEPCALRWNAKTEATFLYREGPISVIVELSLERDDMSTPASYTERNCIIRETETDRQRQTERQRDVDIII